MAYDNDIKLKLNINLILYKAGGPLGAVPDIGSQTIVKFRLMADHEDAALIGGQGTFQFILGIYVKVVGRLIQKQDIGFPVDQLA